MTKRRLPTLLIFILAALLLTAAADPSALPAVDPEPPTPADRARD